MTKNSILLKLYLVALSPVVALMVVLLIFPAASIAGKLTIAVASLFFGAVLAHLLLSRYVVTMGVIYPILARVNKAGDGDNSAFMIETISGLVEFSKLFVGQMRSESAGLKKQMDIICASDNENYQKCTHQLEETEMIAAAVTEMAASAQEVANNTKSAASSAGEATSQGEESQAILQQTIDSFRELAAEVGLATGVVGEVNGDAEQISSILSVIEDISEQTNLLALNAAIEAARAGDHGRGFSVVADEVRKLANRTKDSTEEIRSMIRHLQSKSQDAVVVMERSRELSSNMEHLARDSSSAMSHVREAVSRINDMNIQVASAANQQTSVSEAINLNITKLTELAFEIKASYDNTFEVSEKLNTHTANLYQLSHQANY
ncbi:MAG: methyl-accepting chemotaxis protein [Halopseudomonas sp.]